VEERFEGITDVAHQMETTCGLKRLRGGLSTGQCTGISAIADENGHGEMGLQPLHQGLGVTSLEYGYRSMPFQIDQQRAIGTTPPESEFIHA
jgi:hypothetical protein